MEEGEGEAASTSLALTWVGLTEAQLCVCGVWGDETGPPRGLFWRVAMELCYLIVDAMVG